jgi:hypothetical protein
MDIIQGSFCAVRSKEIWYPVKCWQDDDSGKQKIKEGIMVCVSLYIAPLNSGVPTNFVRGGGGFH